MKVATYIPVILLGLTLAVHGAAQNGTTSSPPTKQENAQERWSCADPLSQVLSLSASVIAPSERCKRKSTREYRNKEVTFKQGDAW